MTNQFYSSEKQTWKTPKALYKKLNDELSKAVLIGNLKATIQKKTYSEADIIIVSINCDLLKIKGLYGIDFDQFTKSIKR